MTRGDSNQGGRTSDFAQESDDQTTASNLSSLGGFVAGTLVWADKGLVPIEKLKVGDLVLAQPEAKGEQHYKRITKTFVHEDKLIWSLQYYDPRKDDIEYIYATGNHPFWIKGVGWVALENIEPGQILEPHDGTEAIVYLNYVIYRTAKENIGFMVTDQSSDRRGIPLDFSNNQRKVTMHNDGAGLSHYFLWDKNGTDGVFFHTRVFNIEVDGRHTYYVGEGGLWAHD